MKTGIMELTFKSFGRPAKPPGYPPGVDPLYSSLIPRCGVPLLSLKQRPAPEKGSHTLIEGCHAGLDPASYFLIVVRVAKQLCNNTSMKEHDIKSTMEKLTLVENMGKKSLVKG